MNSMGTILMGAQRRLLPLWVPYRFFLAATLFHVLAWVLLATAAEQVAGYRGGPSPLLAVLHALTLGVFAMTAIGASLQILPVTTGQALMALWPSKVISWLYVPGVLLLLVGFYTGHPMVLEAGACLSAIGLLVFAVLVGDILRRTQNIFLVFRAYIWAALLALLGLITLGITAVANLQTGFLMDPAAIGLAHFLLAAFGFMGFLTLGFSQILVPMFSLASAPDNALAKSGVALAILAVLLGVVGSLIGNSAFLVLAAAVGVTAAGVYLWIMTLALRGGMRKNLGLSFVMIKAAWVLLPICILTGGAAALGLGDNRLVVLFVFLTLFGWLLTFLLGVLQRVIPFLAAMNAAGWAMPRLSELTGETPLKIHAVCHAIALITVAGGILTNTAIPIVIGASIGAIGAIFYTQFALDVIKRLTLSRKTQKKE